MAHSAAFVETLKRELRARNITYADIARHLGLSHASVKRIFSRREFTLARLDRICALARIEFSDLARAFAAGDSVISRLTAEQEAEFVANQKLMLVAICVLTHWTYDEMVATYDLTPAECVKLLARLDRLKFIELLPNNRYRLLVSPAFTWIPGGPVHQFFRSQAQTDFFSSAFDKDDETLLLTSGCVSKASAAALLERIRRVATDFAEIVNAEAKVPIAHRVPITMLLGARPWEPEFLRRLRRDAGESPKPMPKRIRRG